MKKKPAAKSKTKPRTKAKSSPAKKPPAAAAAKVPATLAYHPLADLLPMMSPPERAALRADVQRVGRVRVPIVLLDGKILDGRNRYEIATELGVPFDTRTFDPKLDGEPIDFVYSSAIHRNLTDTQKACAAVEFLPHFEANAAARMKAGRKGDPTELVPEGHPKLVDGITRDERLAELGELPLALLADEYRKHIGRNLKGLSRADMVTAILLGLYGVTEPATADAPKGEAREQAGELFGVSGRYVSMAKLLKKEAPDLFKLAFEGDPRHPLTVATRVYRSRLKRDELSAKAKAAHDAQPFDGETWQVITGDCVKELPDLDAKARLAFADSPYNEGFDYGDGPAADKLSYGAFLGWCEEWLEALAESLADDGSLFVMINDRFQAELWQRCKQLGLHFRRTILWHETFGSHTDNNFTPCARFVHYFTKHPTRFTWNGDAIRIPSARQETYGDKRADPAGKVPGNVWELPRIVGNAKERMPGFPTQVPVALLERIVLVASDPGDLVIDPFNGSGSTGEAALRHGRIYIGIEKNATNADNARARLAAVAAEVGGPTNGHARAGKEVAGK